MKNLKEIRFVATNYYNLQGLRSLPVSLYLVLICLWVNNQRYPITMKNYLLPTLELICMLILYFGINRYYLHSFGRLERTPESRRLEWGTAIASGVLVMAAFWMDVTYKLPVSLLGLTMALSLLAEYIRITWLVKGRFLLNYPIGVILLAGASLLPVLGSPDWWHFFGIQSQLLGISLLFGFFTIFAGIYSHFFLVHTLSALSEAE